MVSLGALARSKSLTFLLFFILLFAIIYQVHRHKLINESYAPFFGFGTIDPWLIHGSAEEKGKPTQARYDARVNHIKEKCQSYPSDGLFEAWHGEKETYTDIVVDESRRILFCGVPKAATTTWKRIFLKTSFARYADVPLDEIRDGKDGQLSNTHGQDLKYLNDFPLEERKGILRDYFKFLVVRPPFERLLSAYRDKTDRLSFTFFNKKVMESLKERDLADEYIYFDVESFHQFLEFILARTPQPLDSAGDIALEANQMLRNEMRVFDVCRPCSIQYDFIGKFETLQHDMNYLLQKLNLDMEWPETEPTTNADYIRLYYHGLKKDHLHELYTQYGTDFDLFEYKIPSALFDVANTNH